MIYTPTEYSTVEDKERFADQFKKFVMGNNKWFDFPKWFYERLSMCFGHVAHFDQYGFFATWFHSMKDTMAWEKRIIYWKPYGEPTDTFSDVEADLSEWMANYRGLKVQDHERVVVLG